MIPFQMIVLLSVIMLYTAVEPSTGPKLNAGTIMLGVLSVFLFVVLLVWSQTRRAVANLYRTPERASYIAMRSENALQAVRWATIGITAVQLWASGWGPLVTADTLRGGWDLVRFPAVAELVLLAPPLLTWVALWMIHFRVEQTLHDQTLPYRLAGGLPTHEMPSRRSYVFMQIRHQFFVMLPILGLEVLSRTIDNAWPHMNATMSLIVTVGMLLLGLTLLPTLIVMIWKTQPLTGPLRERLESLARRHRLRYRNILVWQTHHFISNAAVLGYLPFSRYFLLSDALLEALSDQQIEAVFAHELGHVRHKHIWWYVALIMAGASLATAGSSAIHWLAVHYAPQQSASWLDAIDMTTEAGLLMAFLWLIFFPVSRQFEHQADWFATRHLAESLMHDPQQVITIDPDALPAPTTAPEVMTTEEYIAGYMTPGGTPAAVSSARGAARLIPLAVGAGVFTSALGRIISISNRSYDNGGWLHPSPRARDELLKTLASDPRALGVFESRMFKIRVAIAAIVLVSIAASIGAAYLPEPHPKPQGFNPGKAAQQ